MTDDQQLDEILEDLIYSFTDDDISIQPDRPYKIYDKNSVKQALLQWRDAEVPRVLTPIEWLIAEVVEGMV